MRNVALKRGALKELINSLSRFVIAEPKRAKNFGSFKECPQNGALGEIRTPDPQIRSLMLYPAELRARQVHISA